MNTQKSLLAATILLLLNVNHNAQADIVVTQSYHGETNQFQFSNQFEVADNFFSKQILALYPASNTADTKRVIQINDTTSGNILTIIRPAYDTYVVAQPAKNGDMTFTKIQKAGGVQEELYRYLRGDDFSADTKVTSGTLDKVTQAKVNTELKAAANSSAGAVFDGTSLNKIKALSDSSKQSFTKALDTTFNNSTISTTPVTTSPFQSYSSSKVNDALKNGVTQGNPASYVAQMAYYDQTLDLGGVLANAQEHNDADAHAKSRVAVKARLSNYSFGSQDTQIYTITASYTHELSKGWALLFDTPLSYVSGNNSSTYNVAMGAGIRIPVARYDKVNWDLVPLVRIGGANLDCVDSSSLKCADSSFVYSGGIQSNLALTLGAGYSLILHDQYTYQSIDTLSSSVVVNSLLKAVSVPNGTVDVYRNGAQLLKDLDFSLCGRKLSSSLSFADTRFSSSYGSFIDSQQEYGLNLNLRDTAHKQWVKDFKVGINYTSAKHMSDAVSGTMAISF